MNPARVAPDPVLSDVVRQRLAALLAEVPARRAMNEPVWTDDDEVASGLLSDRAGSVGAAQSETADDQTRQDVPVVAARLGEAGRVVWDFSRSHLGAVALVVLTGCLWGGFNVLQARSTPVVPVATPSVVVAPTPSRSAAPTVLVHVLGEVRRPGVVELPEGARVKDGIAAAGGLTDKAVPGELNLAAVVSDGSQLVIGSKRAPGSEVRSGETSSPATGSSGGRISLNTATVTQLEDLPGVGPVTAQRIIAWREEHERFTRIEELQEVSGIGAKTFSEIAPYVRV